MKCEICKQRVTALLGIKEYHCCVECAAMPLRIEQLSEENKALESALAEREAEVSQLKRFGRKIVEYLDYAMEFAGLYPDHIAEDREFFLKLITPATAPEGEGR